MVEIVVHQFALWTGFHVLTGVIIFDCAPARQTTRTFFSGRNNDRAPARHTTRTFFSGRNNDRAPARQTTVFVSLSVCESVCD